jgi:hypothetical protein
MGRLSRLRGGRRNSRKLQFSGWRIWKEPTESLQEHWSCRVVLPDRKSGFANVHPDISQTAKVFDVQRGESRGLQNYADFAPSVPD